MFIERAYSTDDSNNSYNVNYENVLNTCVDYLKAPAAGTVENQAANSSQSQEKEQEIWAFEPALCG